MGAGVGPQYISSQSFKEMNTKQQDLIDEEIDSILTSQYQRAKSLLENNKDLLDLLANELIKKESLSGQEIEQLLKNEIA